MRLAEKYPDTIQRIFAKYPIKRSAIIYLLYLAQHEYGYISDEAVADVAGLLDADPTEVRAVAGFYSLFFKRPVGKFVLHFCNDMPCSLRGAEDFLKLLADKLGIQPGETTPDGLFTLEPAMCLAACDRAPMMQVNLEYHENLTEERVDQLLADLRRRAQAEEKTHPIP